MPPPCQGQPVIDPLQSLRLVEEGVDIRSPRNQALQAYYRRLGLVEVGGPTSDPTAPGTP
jgi:hypothetical protein